MKVTHCPSRRHEYAHGIAPRVEYKIELPGRPDVPGPANWGDKEQ